MHLCLIPSHDESWGPSFNRRAEQRRNFILTSQWGRRSYRVQAPGTVLLCARWTDAGSPAPWAVFAATSDSCSWPKQCCVLPPHVSASFTSSSLPASAGSTSQASVVKTAAPCTCSGCWRCAWELAGQGCLALGRNVTWAEEICQELFSYLFPELHRYTELTGAKPWLMSTNF